MTLPPITLDLAELRATLLRQREPRRVHYFEHGIADNVKQAVAERYDLWRDVAAGRPETAWEKEIIVQRFLGQEVFRVWLPGGEYAVPGSKGTTWGEEHAGPIQSWADVRNYRWPDPQQINYAELEWYERHLPVDMGVLHVVKIWEVVRELFGFESFCLKLYEAPGLIAEVVRRVGEFHLALTRALCKFRCVFAVYGADDYGYKTATMMAPDLIRQLFLPWHKQMAALAHARDKLFFFHCCGKVDELMDDFIGDLRIDAKHSFEDVIVPVTEAKRRWGDRVALLGGLDADFIARADATAIRHRVRETLAVCQRGGGYCLGLGNWVADYIPVDNYLAVLDEGRRYT